MDYATLADIARARGDDAQADEWQRKCDDLLAELKRRAGGSGGLPPQAVQSILSLAAVCARAGFESQDLPPDAEAALAQLAAAPPPFASLVPFLRGLAAGETVRVPDGLPSELGEVLGQLLDAIGETRG